MKWSLKIGSFAGIGVYLHWTFAVLLVWVFAANVASGRSLGQAFGSVGFILALFACVVLHEYGHALTARHYGVSTRDITLLPIGGVARLEKLPENPVQEFWIALAGPAVNVAIAAALFGLRIIWGGSEFLSDSSWLAGGFIHQLMWVNLFIVAFNLLPAFPMDGGRVLRALLALRVGRTRATVIAANIGQVMAVLFGIVGVLFNPLLIFIAVVVFLGAQAEAAHVGVQSALEGLHVRDAMMTRFRTLSPTDSLRAAVEELLAGSQQEFPVLDRGKTVGVLRRDDLLRALADGRNETPVGEVMCRDYGEADESDALIPALEAMNHNHCATPVTGGGRLVGLLTMENISELVVVNESMHRPAAAADHK